MVYLLGIDIGTSGTKTALYDRRGQSVASHTIEYPMYQPQNGWAEQEPEDWWQAVAGGIRAVLAASAVAPGDIAGIGLSGQMHGLVLLDEDGRVLRPSIIWCDQRTGEQAAWLEREIGRERLVAVTANPAITGFTAAKLLWVRDHEPDVYRRTRHILLPKDYIRYRLTGAFATEVSDASGMQLLNIGKRDWDAPLLADLRIDRALLADVYESPDISAHVSAEGAAATGLLAGTPVAGGAGDNAAAAVGTGVVTEGRAFTTIGTSGVVYAHTNEMHIDPAGRVHTFCCAVPGAWHVMGVTQGAGLSLQWFRNQFCGSLQSEAHDRGISVYRLMDELAATVPVGSERLIYLPYLMGERTPHLNPDARGVFFGLSAMHETRHLIRAVLEGVSFSQLDSLSIIRGMGLDVDDMRATGGGATPFWQQMLADVYNCPVSTLAENEGPSLGVALLAATGVGLYDSVPEACAAAIETAKTAAPDPERVPRYAAIYPLYQEIYRRLEPLYQDLAGLPL
ncbi:MAG: xylulokinase [Bacillota bacterium]|nr:xylulokinase [Bacillota bacterium]